MTYRYRGRIYDTLELTQTPGLILSDQIGQILHTGTIKY